MFYCEQCGAANARDVLVCFACKRPLNANEDLLENEPLLHGRYRLLTQVGTGGYGAVYKAQDTQDSKRTVAIKKIVLRGLKPHEKIDATDTFNREVQILPTLHHAGLPRVYDHFTDSDNWYLVMEFIEGESLERYLRTKGGRVSVLESCHIGIQLCTVLEYLHTRQPAVIFRDLKPANIMITPLKQLYLIDFGTARFFKPGRPRDTVAFGSPGYAAPEQYGKAQTTMRSDIYSLGATLHQLLTGVDPADDPFHFVPLCKLEPGMPQELETLLSTMVELQESKRPGDAAIVKAELQRVSISYARALHPLPVTPPTYPIWVNGTLSANSQPSTQYYIPSSSAGGQAQMMAQPAQKQAQKVVPANKNKGPSRRVILGGLIALTVGGGNWLSHLPNSPSPAPVSVPLGISSDQGDFLTLVSDDATMHHAPIRALSWSPSDPVRVISASFDKVAILEPNPAPVSPFEMMLPQRTNNVTAVACMGKRHGNFSLAVTSYDRNITLWDAESGLALKNFDGAAKLSDGTVFQKPITSLAWSLDNTQLAVAEGETVHIFSYIEDNQSFLRQMSYTGHKAAVTCLAWSPVGNAIASGSLDKTIHIWSAENTARSSTKVAQTIYEGHSAAIQALCWGATEGFYGIVSCAANGDAQIWKQQSGKKRLQRSDAEVFLNDYLSAGTAKQIVDVALSPYSKYLACACLNEGVLLFNLLDHSHLYGWASEPLIKVAWSRSGEQFAAGGKRGKLLVWNVDTYGG